MRQVSFLIFTFTVLLMIINDNLAELPITKCESFYLLRSVIIKDIELLKQEAESGNAESALALVVLHKFISDENYNPHTCNSRLTELNLLSKTNPNHINLNIKEAFSEQTYAECKHVFEPTTIDTTNSEETLFNDRED